MAEQLGVGLLFVGGGGHAVVVAEAAQSLCEQTGLRPLGCLDDHEHPALARPPGAIPRLGPLSDLPALASAQVMWILSMGDLAVRRGVLDQLPAQLSIGSAWTVTHPNASVSRSALIGRGTYIGPLSVVHARATIGSHAIINSGAIIEHHADLGENTHIAPAAVVAGEAAVGADSLIGMGAMVLPGVRIGRGCTVGAGAVVRADVPDGATVVGVPARVLR